MNSLIPESLSLIGLRLLAQCLHTMVININVLTEVSIMSMIYFQKSYLFNFHF